MKDYTGVKADNLWLYTTILHFSNIILHEKRIPKDDTPYDNLFKIQLKPSKRILYIK